MKIFVATADVLVTADRRHMIHGDGTANSSSKLSDGEREAAEEVLAEELYNKAAVLSNMYRWLVSSDPKPMEAQK